MKIRLNQFFIEHWNGCKFKKLTKNGSKAKKISKLFTKQYLQNYLLAVPARQVDNFMKTQIKIFEIKLQQFIFIISD